MIKEATNKGVFIWNILGSLANALASMVFLVIVNRALGVENGDIFSIAFSVTQMMLTIGTFQVRVYQSTDISNKFSFNDYFYFRILTCALMVIVTIVYGIVMGFNNLKLCIIIILCFYRVIESFSDVFQGFFQQYGRLDIAGKAVTYKIIGAVLSFLATAIITNDLAISTIMMLLMTIIIFYFCDYRYYINFIRWRTIENDIKGKFKYKNIKNLCLICFPLFLNAYIVMSIFNIPKLAIETSMISGTLIEGSQTYYSIIFMPAAVLNLIIIAFRPLITSMAVSFGRKDFTGIYKVLSMICLCIVGMGIVAVVGAYFLGIPILSLIYGTGDALLPHKGALIVIVIAGCINSLANIVDNVITIFRKQKYLIVSYLFTWIVASLISDSLVLNYGVYGAAISFLISMLTLLISVVLIFIACTYKIKNER